MMGRKSSPLTTLLRATGSIMAGAAGGWVLYSLVGINHEVPLKLALDAESVRFASKTRPLLHYYVSMTPESTRAPLVLIHSINAAGSPYELRPIFEQYQGTRDIYALDLPGFGFSDRSDREYTPAVYVQAIVDLLERIGKKADVIALSLGCEFAAQAAMQRPDLFDSLTMISPSGFNRRDNKGASQAAQQSGSSDFFYRVFSFPLWGRAFYDLIATRMSIHYFLQQSFVGEVDPALEAYSYQTSHQPGAHYAPLYFVSGKLFTPDIREKVYAKLTIPVLVLFDTDAFVKFDMLPAHIEQHANWQAERIAPTRGLPQFEQMEAVAKRLDQFWGT